MQSPCLSHWKAVKQILYYLNGTSNHGICLTSSSLLSLHGFCDADWANDPDDRRSTSGFCWFLGSSPITWSSKKQPVVSRSGTKAEYRSLANATSELLWLQSLHTELHVHSCAAPILWCDNISTISLSANPVLHSKSKHFELDLFFVREKELAKQLDVQFVPSSDQIVDVFTKALTSTAFHMFRSKLSNTKNPTLTFPGDVK